MTPQELAWIVPRAAAMVSSAEQKKAEIVASLLNWVSKTSALVRRRRYYLCGFHRNEQTQGAAASSVRLSKPLLTQYELEPRKVAA
jgi:hypothetical protein